MEKNTQSPLDAWRIRCEHIQSLTLESEPEVIDKAMRYCGELHGDLKQIADEETYTGFLSAYSRLLSFNEKYIEQEIVVQDELTDIRRKQIEEGREPLSRLANSLFYLGFAHLRALNSRKAMCYVDEAVDIEKKLPQQYPSTISNGLAASLYLQAITYDRFGRNILAEDSYKDCIAEYDRLISCTPSASTELKEILADVIVEFGDFYERTRFFDYAIDRYLQAIEVYRELPPIDRVTEKLLTLYTALKERYEAKGNNEQSNHYVALINELTQKENQ